MNYIHLIFLFYLSACSAALGDISDFCTEDPPLAVEPGSVLSMKILNSFRKECTAELEFSDGTPGMRWQFKAAECADTQLAQLSVPFDVPNGFAHITWQCDEDNSLSCNRIVISKGKGDLAPRRPRLVTETASCISATTFLTRVVTPDKGKPTGIFLDSRILDPIISGAPSTPASKNLDSKTTTPSTAIAFTPVTPRLPWNGPTSYRSLIGTGGTRRNGETSARLLTDTSTLDTAINTPITTTITMTNTASITIPTVIPIEETTTTSASTTASHTTKRPSTNRPSYSTVTVTSFVSSCPMPMPASTN